MARRFTSVCCDSPIESIRARPVLAICFHKYTMPLFPPTAAATLATMCGCLVPAMIVAVFSIIFLSRVNAAIPIFYVGCAIALALCLTTCFLPTKWCGSHSPRPGGDVKLWGVFRGQGGGGRGVMSQVAHDGWSVAQQIA